MQPLERIDSSGGEFIVPKAQFSFDIKVLKHPISNALHEIASQINDAEGVPGGGARKRVIAEMAQLLTTKV